MFEREKESETSEGNAVLSLDQLPELVIFSSSLSQAVRQPIVTLCSCSKQCYSLLVFIIKRLSFLCKFNHQ